MRHLTMDLRLSGRLIGTPFAPSSPVRGRVLNRTWALRNCGRKEPEMTSRPVRVRDEQKLVQQITTYFGINVEVLVQMEYYSLIVCRNRKLIVCTGDLQSVSAIKQAA
jgi:hypothetical protein